LKLAAGVSVREFHGAPHLRGRRPSSCRLNQQTRKSREAHVRIARSGSGRLPRPREGPARGSRARQRPAARRRSRCRRRPGPRLPAHRCAAPLPALQAPAPRRPGSTPSTAAPRSAVPSSAAARTAVPTATVSAGTTSHSGQYRGWRAARGPPLLVNKPRQMDEWPAYVHPKKHAPVQGRLCAVRLPDSVGEEIWGCPAVFTGFARFLSPTDTERHTGAESVSCPMLGSRRQGRWSRVETRAFPGAKGRDWLKIGRHRRARGAGIHRPSPGPSGPRRPGGGRVSSRRPPGRRRIADMRPASRRWPGSPAPAAPTAGTASHALAGRHACGPFASRARAAASRAGRTKAGAMSCRSSARAALPAVERAPPTARRGHGARRSPALQLLDAIVAPVACHHRERLQF
jgi:hypothetical protein